MFSVQVPQDRIKGERKKKRIEEHDQEKRDDFLTQDLSELKDASHLFLIIGNALLEGDIKRRTCVLSQIRRSYMKPGEDDDGNPIIDVKGNIKRKTN